MNRGVLILLLLFASVSYASFAGIGSITEQTNSPGTIKRSNQIISGVKGSPIEMNDSVQTQIGKLGILFEDQTRVEINEHSKLVIDDFVYDPKSKSGGKLGLKFAQGTMRYASGAIAHNDPSSVKLNTPSATIGVRGTDFSATVDEFGESTIILLPSCPKNWVDIERDCKTGIIDVYNDAGLVTLDKPFQGTKVVNRNMPPLKPTTLNLTADQINNLLIVSPPQELTQKDKKDKGEQKSYHAGDMLEVDFLKQDFLKNELAQNFFGDNPLTQPLLQQSFLEDIFDILSKQLLQDNSELLANLLNPENQLLPDWFKESLVTKQVTTLEVDLCRNDGSNVQCVYVPKDQNTLLVQVQDGVTIKNRVNSGKSTIITLRQN